MKLKKTWLVILLLSLLVCSGCNKKTEQENVETKQETESIPEKEEIRPSGYIKDEILQYFKLSETELESWNKIEKIREYDPEPRVATYTFYSQDGKVNDNTQLFENSSLEVRACRPTEYSRKHSNIFKDLTGHEDTFVYALVMRAGDVFRGISEQETWETVEKWNRRL